jgi:hypothetical protein
MNPQIDVSELGLRDIHLPSDIGWWPPAFGWWILAALVVGAAAFLVYRYMSRYRERAAAKAIRRVVTRLEAGAEPVSCVQQVSAVLRRFVISVSAPNDPVAGLTGPRWLEYLDNRWERAAFSAGPGRELIVAPYAPAGRVSAEAARDIASLSLDWVDAQRRRR